MPSLTFPAGHPRAGTELTYDDRGEGPVVMVLGNLPGSHTWETTGIEPAVREAGYRTITLGSGAVEPGAIDDAATTVTVLLDFLGADRCAVIGYQGAALTMLRAAQRDPRVVAAVLGGIGMRNVGNAQLAAVTVPTLVVAGEDDHLAGDLHGVAHQLPAGVGKQIAGDEVSALLDPSFGGEIVSFLSTHLR